MERELHVQSVVKATFFGFETRKRVVGNHLRQAPIGAVFVAKDAGTVKRMELVVRQSRCMADVVVDGHSDEEVANAG